MHWKVVEFIRKWGPDDGSQYDLFLADLRALLEDYGRAALKHESLPDTEHEHGDPV